MWLMCSRTEQRFVLQECSLWMRSVIWDEEGLSAEPYMSWEAVQTYFFIQWKCLTFEAIIWAVNSHWTRIHHAGRFLWDQLTRLVESGNKPCIWSLWDSPGVGQLEEDHKDYMKAGRSTQLLRFGSWPVTWLDMLRFILTCPPNLTCVFVGSCVSFPWSDALARAFPPWIFPCDYQPLNSGHLILASPSDSWNLSSSLG